MEGRAHLAEPYPFRNLDEPPRRVIDAFGARRRFRGTDLSRMLAHCTYRQGLTHHGGIDLPFRRRSRLGHGRRLAGMPALEPAGALTVRSA
jgi:hypothetical protein